jgi:hypothetical protein
MVIELVNALTINATFAPMNPAVLIRNHVHPQITNIINITSVTTRRPQVVLKRVVKVVAKAAQAV